MEDASSCGSGEVDQPSSSDALYEAKSAADFEEWTLGGSWGLAGDLLVSSGGYFPYITMQMGDSARAPVVLEDQNYAVEVEMEVIDSPNGESRCLVCAGGSFGIIARSGGGTGYAAGFAADGERPLARIVVLSDAHNWPAVTIAPKSVKFGPGFHTVRLELKDNTLKMLVDDKVVLRSTDNSALEPGWTGMFSDDAQVSVRMFAICPL